MRKRSTWVSAILALAIGTLFGCGGSQPASTASSGSTCINATAPHHAYVVVQHLSAGHQLQKCVGFTGDSIDGQTLMDQSGIEYQTQTFSFGKAVCQVDKEPAQYSSCFEQSGPNWLLFVDSGGKWAEAQTGYAQVTLHDKDALGWEYTANQSAVPPSLPRE